MIKSSQSNPLVKKKRKEKKSCLSFLAVELTSAPSRKKDKSVLKRQIAKQPH